MLCETRLVEVKGPGDSLSEHQKSWIEAYAGMRVTRPETDDDEMEEEDGTPESENEEEEERRLLRKQVAKQYPLFELARVLEAEVVREKGVGKGGGGGRKKKQRTA